MAQNSKIEWTRHTANLWWGCTEVHDGCDNCYARVLTGRYGTKWGNETPRKEIKGFWGGVLSMQAKASAAFEVHRVFVGSMMDIFEKPMPVVNHIGESMPYNTGALRRRFFEEIVPNNPNLMFLLLTKRPSNISKYIPEEWKSNPPQNVMFGTSPVNQTTFDTLTRQLKQVNGKRFLSVEPQLEHISLENLTGIDWIIQGGESGPRKRPFSTDWARSMRDECAALGIPYFFKQIDKVQPIPADLMIREFPK